MFDLSGKVAIVTGSTKGIGKSIAENMAALGAKVVISSRKPAACEKVADEIKAKGHEATAIPCHIGKKEALETLVSETITKYGKIDILVCNAATNPVYGSMLNAGDEAYDKIMDTNVKSVFQICNMVCPGMAERKDGEELGQKVVAETPGGLLTFEKSASFGGNTTKLIAQTGFVML